MNVLVIDIGGTHVKLLATGQDEPREFASGKNLTPKRLVSNVLKIVKGWRYDVVSIGYPGPVLRNRPISEPWNLGKGWRGFNFEAAFGCPVKFVNDAAMQALGSYKGGKMLFLGFGTGLGSAMIVDAIVEPMELGHLPYKKATFEDYVGLRGLDKCGIKKWRKNVADVVKRLITALEPEDVVLGGGNVHKLKKLPPACRAGDNHNAFLGGFRLWKEADASPTRITASGPSRQTMRIGIAADHGGFELKEKLAARLREAGHNVTDFGAHALTPDDDYPDFVIPLSRAVAAGKVDRGIAVCGSGVGAAVCANKIKGVRACLIEDHFSAKQGVEDDDLNVICLGGRIQGPELVWDLIQTFLAAKFSRAPRHVRRLKKLAALEQRR